MTFSSETMRAWVEVDLAALVGNARKVAAVSGSRLLPMVKANGYGLGAVEVAHALEMLDPWGYGVASADEGAALRAARIARPILVTTPLLPASMDHYLDLDLRPAIGDPAALDSWVSRSDRPFHIEVDTGMSRGGVRWSDHAALEHLRTALDRAPGWEGVFTHFLDAESDPRTAGLQWDRFHQVLRSLPRHPALVHAANSAAALQGSCYAADLVRPGIFLYGGTVGQAVPVPVAALQGRVVALRTIDPGDSVGYGGSWCADAKCVIATITVGYADGFPRSPGNAGTLRQIELGGRLRPIVGRVTMDMCMAVVEGDTAIGDVATVFGGLISIDEQAEAAGTISYEVLTRLGSRVPPAISGREVKALNGELPAGAEQLGDARRLAQTFIDTLGMLAERTAGHLEPDEKQLLDQAVTALRFRFVQIMPKA